MGVKINYALLALLLGSPIVILFVVFVPAALRGLATAVGVIALSFAVWRAFRIEIRFDAGGITVRNYMRTYYVPWNEVSELGPGIEMLDVVAVETIAIRPRARSVITAQAAATAASKREWFLGQLTDTLERYRSHGSVEYTGG